VGIDPITIEVIIGLGVTTGTNNILI